MWKWLSNIFNLTRDKPGKEAGISSDDAALALAFHSLGGNVKEYKSELINPSTAMAYAAWWACVRYISSSLAVLDWCTYKWDDEYRTGRTPIYDDVYWLCNIQANPEVPAHYFREAAAKDALVCGNHYSEIERDNNGDVKWLWRISPDRVEVVRYVSGRLAYQIKNDKGQVERVLDPVDIFHVRGPSPDGIVGYSVVELARRTLSLGIQLDKYGDSYFRRGPMPGGILNVPGAMDGPKRRQLQESFQNAYGGGENAGKVVVLSGNLEFTPLGMPNTDAEYLLTRKFQVEEIARWFGVPLHKLGELSNSTNNNIEHQSIEAVQDCLLPWARRFEAEADVKLYGRKDRGNKFTKLKLGTLLRGDSRSQAEYVARLTTAGVMLLDEGRDYLDLNPLPEGLGQKPLIQGAMESVERIISGEADEPAGDTQYREPSSDEQDDS